MKEKRSLILVLDNIRSVHNVGSAFRTADAAGVEKMYLVGVTSAPVDRFGRRRKDLAKVSLGAEETVPWEHMKDAAALIENFKKEKRVIFVLEQDNRSVDYKTVSVSKESALVVGNEVTGVSKEFLDAADTIIEIPMNGMKESLNVSVSLGIVLFRILGI